MLNVSLENTKSGKQLAIKDKPDFSDIIVTEPVGRFAGVFKSASRNTAGTTIIASPTGNGNGGIVLTDLIWSTDKVNSATVTIQFNDGTNQEVIFSADITDAPTSGAIAFQGNWEGWRGARLELVTTGVVEARVTCGYYKISEDAVKSYSNWDSLR